ncbi:type III secretion system protein [Pantoea deleyi]|uniref:Acyl carrier protein n=1 Tax=Pantoea deleyi TaxID=470932 RepID=A0A506Q7P9_9GAMM|nr:acyl carrier protein [Pantoea deleyi]ORM83731.1 type III secretion system protein [Pantoea deleyi]TPV42094.1 acyl carrier protein [Pantoea deleyi]
MNDVVVDKKVVSLVLYLIYQVNGVPPEKIKPEDSLITDLTMDSVELIDLLMRLEEIGVTIPESEISSRLTVADLIQRVQESA